MDGTKGKASPFFHDVQRMWLAECWAFISATSSAGLYNIQSLSLQHSNFK